MHVIRFSDPDAFIQTAAPYLLGDEAANGLMLGIADRLRQDIAGYGDLKPYLAVVQDEVQDGKGSQGPVAVAIMTPPYSLLVQSNAEEPERSFSLLANDLIAGGWTVPGVNGPSDLAETFADIWADRNRLTYRTEMELRTFKLTAVNQRSRSPGRMRGAEITELELIIDWAQAFTAEAIGENEEFDRSRARTRFAKAVSEETIFFWDNNGPVSIASCGRPTAHGIAVNMVYTPPQLRGCGYAGSCVATLSQRLLDDGWQFCTLFTDVTNPTSNSIYQRIGYRPVCDFTHYMFQ